MTAASVTPAPATMSRRMIAYLLDAAIVAFGSLVAVSFFSAFTLGNARAAADPYTTVVLNASLSFAYFFLSWTASGASPAQRLLGLRTLTYGETTFLGQRDAVLRWAYLYGPSSLAVPLLAVMAPGSSALANLTALGYFVVLYSSASRDPEHRGLHDRKGGSIVVRSAPSAVYAPPAATGERPIRLDPVLAGSVLFAVGAFLALQRLATVWQLGR